MGSCGTNIQKDVEYISNIVDPSCHPYAERKTVCGYIRELKSLLLKERCIDTPNARRIDHVIVNIIAFYLYYYKPQFDTQILGRRYVEFISSAVVTITKKSYWSTLVFGTEITSGVCNRYDIYVRAVATSFYIGFVTSNVFMSPNKNYVLGRFKNSVGIYINSRTHKMEYYDQCNASGSCKCLSNSHFKRGDTLVLSINFEQDCFELYHKDICVVRLSLNGLDSIIPAFSLSHKNDLIDVVKWKVR
eukprot:338256_1